MDHLSWEKLKDIFTDAIEMPAAERIAFVHGACDGNLEFESEVISLLEASETTRNLIEENVFELSKQIAEDGRDLTGQRFGNYAIVQEIGHGGMGTVFLARRVDGEFDQDVALKLVRQSIADSLVIERFRRERQILAGLNHPNIAALHDGGISDFGEPFIAMEFVDGVSLTEYVKAKKLSVDECLTLFLKVCSAVAYAHRNLVIHRDIKPSNILITGGGEPKLLDFGLAKAFESDLSKTQTTARAFTPAYASPEQITGKNITTASDIYSLGVVFYELLTGSKPLDLENKSFDEVLNTIKTSQPIAPSVMANYKAPGHRALKGDLDNITLMALRKEPDRRYRSVEDFAGDVTRYLDGLPVIARPNTFGYRAGKFLKRNKIVATAVMLITLAVFAGLGIALWQANVARRESARSDAVNKFMQQMLLTADPSAGSGGKRGAQATIVDILKQAESRLDKGELSTEPEVRAEVRQLIGEGYKVQGLYADAERALTASFEEKSAIFGRDTPATLTSEYNLARLYLAKADYQRADEIFTRRYAQFRSELSKGRMEPAFVTSTLSDHGVAARATGNSTLAEALIREAIDVADANSLPQYSFRSLLSLILFDQGRFEEARSSQETMVDNIRQKGISDDPDLCSSLTLLGSIRMESGDLATAMTSLKEAEGIYRRLFGNQATPLYDNLRLQAQVNYLQGSYKDAEEKIDMVLVQYVKNSSPKYISYATALTIKGLIDNKLGLHSDALATLREALRLRSENLPPEHFMTALTEGALGEVLLDEKNYTEAEPLLRRSLESLTLSQKIENPRLKLARDRVTRLETELYQKIR